MKQHAGHRTIDVSELYGIEYRPILSSSVAVLYFRTPFTSFMVISSIILISSTTTIATTINSDFCPVPQCLTPCPAHKCRSSSNIMTFTTTSLIVVTETDFTQVFANTTASS
ncbi:hypothetical protein JAAARDRAFT_201223 [Jaapia argillacea MUCL 33604]|uniref:Uncharacterized protein n=1 Tax=Jaapia argillacea MUCL 33604 TaxID=933084 RepID=A0A067P2P1_9AGAM|nr:hypothetical protein JAAARDRAFT_201223 [Jaapia argillacea MUCL 33604]